MKKGGKGRNNIKDMMHEKKRKYRSGRHERNKLMSLYYAALYYIVLYCVILYCSIRILH
jgi:hypothetical protein